MVLHPLLESRVYGALRLIGQLGFMRFRAAGDPRDRRGVHSERVGLIERYRTGCRSRWAILS